MKSRISRLSRPFPLILLAILLAFYAVAAKATDGTITAKPNNPDLVSTMPDNLPKATFAGGCFWCLESEFRKQPGVVYTVSGYAGGHVEHPSYEQVSQGRTGHAEALEIYYDPEKTDYQTLLDHFLRRAHDPTTKDAQWVDHGSQYRSAIFYHDDAQKQMTEDTIARINAEKIYKNPIVTEVVAAPTFWPAEDYHQQYYEKYEDRTGQAHVRLIAKEKIKSEKYGTK